MTQDLAYDNIPSVRIARLAAEFRRVKNQIAVLQREADQLWDDIARLGPGKYKDVVIYEVRETRVRSFTRASHKAIRARYE